MSLDLMRYPDMLVALLPELVLTVGGLLLVLVVAARHRSAADLRFAGALAFATLAAGGAATWWLWAAGATAAGGPALIALDHYRLAATALLLGTGALTVLLSEAYLEREGLLAPEFYPLLVFATLGMMLMAAGDDLMVVFLGLELMSICVYVLAGIDRRSPQAAEAAFKYFLIGAFASAFLLYGIALAYGATGTTNLTVMGAMVRGLGLGHSPMLLFGLGLLVIGFGFKVAAVPFHMWAPDVYDGAPTPVTGYMAAGVKAAAFVALVRVLVEGFATVPAWHGILWWLAVLTMLGGNAVALVQRRVKRMLAYSSVAQAGYLLAAVTTGTPIGSAAVLFFLSAYLLTTLAAFALLAAKGRHGEQDVQIDDLAGLATSHPGLALALAICMLSLLGFPGTAGFIGKWYILVAATGAGQGMLAVVLAIATIMSAGYYLPVIMAMYMKAEPSPETHAGMQLGRVPAAVVAAAVLSLLVLGVAPGGALDLARSSGNSLGTPAAIIAAPPGR